MPGLPDPATDGVPGRLRVLIVDDDPGVRHLIDRVLTRRGHSTVAASTACEADALLLDFPAPPDVAVLDIMLPGIHGLAFADQLTRRYPKLRVVFITGWLDHPDRTVAETRGRVLSKPFTVPALIEAIGS